MNNIISVVDHHGHQNSKVVILAQFAKKVFVEDERVIAICAIHPNCSYQTTNHLSYDEKTGEVGVSTLAAGYLDAPVDTIEEACAWLNAQELKSIFNTVEGVANIRWEPATIDDVKANHNAMAERAFERRAARLAARSGNGVPHVASM